MSNNLLNNTASLQNILEALQNKAASGGGNVENRMIEVEAWMSVNPAYYITSSYELGSIKNGTVAALDGMVFYNGVYRLDPISGDYTYHEISPFQMIKFNADGGRFQVINSGGGGN